MGRVALFVSSWQALGFLLPVFPCKLSAGLLQISLSYMAAKLPADSLVMCYADMAHCMSTSMDICLSW